MMQKNLQKISDKQYPYVYFYRLLIEKGFGWMIGQRSDIDYDMKHKRIVITESNDGMG